MSAPSDNDENAPWAWLGLLKWSLAYQDGTVPSDQTLTTMTEEDKEFLEKVMAEGIIDENERMKVILKELTVAMESFQAKSSNGVDLDSIEDLLLELRDIVEQVDYARAFCAMKGLDFLLGCVQERETVPQVVRLHCFGILATLCQNNPPVQNQLLELESLRIFSTLYFVEQDNESNDARALQARIIQAISANVRNNEMAEQIYCEVPQGTTLVESALQATYEALRKRGLFFLRALVTSDASTRERVRKFGVAIAHVADNYLKQDETPEIRELSLDLLNEILEQRKSVNVVLSRRNPLVELGVKQIASLRSLSGEEKEFVAVELASWEKLLMQLARAEPDDETDDAPLLLANVASAENTPTEALPQ